MDIWYSTEYWNENVGKIDDLFSKYRSTNKYSRLFGHQVLKD